MFITLSVACARKDIIKSADWFYGDGSERI